MKESEKHYGKKKQKADEIGGYYECITPNGKYIDACHEKKLCVEIELSGKKERIEYAMEKINKNCLCGEIITPEKNLKITKNIRNEKFPNIEIQTIEQLEKRFGEPILLNRFENRIKKIKKRIYDNKKRFGLIEIE